ncbi:MAG: tRNA (adenosine(37)-N6)-threonylcarbamoyltransferase complex dimerization subunit type 1 TsaB [Chloroflexota bacterium]
MLLAIDTSTRTMGIALYDGARLWGEAAWSTADHHTVELAPAVADLLRRCGATIGAVTALGVAVGPGSFTGLRIGLALAKGIALAHHLPLIGVPTLDVTAVSQPLLTIPLVAVLQAGRGRLAVDWYHVENRAFWQSDGRLEVLTAQALAERLESKCLVCGELGAAERQLLAQHGGHIRLASPANSLRRPGLLAELAWNRWQAGKTDDPATLAPIYLHVGEPIPS